MGRGLTISPTLGGQENGAAMGLPPGILPQGPTQLEPLPPMGRVCSKLPPAPLHRPHSLSVHARLPAPALPLVGRAVGGSSCGLLVPGERGSVGLSSRPTPTGSAEAKEVHRCSTLRRSYLPSGTTGMVVHQGSAPPPDLQEAESPLHRSVPDTEADKRSHLPASPTTRVQNSPHLSCVPTSTLLSFTFRTPGTRLASSSRDPRPTIGLPGQEYHGLTAAEWPA